ncbi:MAG: right-handed parallel beta-helix repeat-containing protein [Pseudomonadota bacterium]
MSIPSRLSIFAACLSLTCQAPAAAQDAHAGRVLRVGQSETVRTIAQAARLAQDGDIVEIEAGEYVGDVAVWTQSELTLRAVHGRARLTAAGASAEGKAIWVVRGGNITIENIDFRGARVPDRNGAGIRFEQGRLVIRNCSFIDNENGILTAGGGATLEIENSEFGYNGAGDGFSHNVYVGPLEKFKVTGSYFHHARIGHLLKSRARENLVLYNRLSDESGGQASYELEFPNGGVAYVIGNLIEQSATTENSIIISFGAEGYAWTSNELYLASNTIVDDSATAGTFLFVKPGKAVVRAVNNLLVANLPREVQPPSKQAAQSAANMATADTWALVGSKGRPGNNSYADRTQFVFPAGFDYHLKAPSSLTARFIPPGSANQLSLVPQYEYVHPSAIRGLSAKPSVPGAFQLPDSGLQQMQGQGKGTQVDMHKH